MSVDNSFEEANIVENAHRHPTGSFAYTLWWSLRMEMCKDDIIKQWAADPAKTFEDWLLYLEFKWDQLESHRKANSKEQADERD